LFGTKGFLSYESTNLLLSVVVGGGTKPLGAYGLILFLFWFKLRRSSPDFLFSGIKGFFNWVLTNFELSVVVGGGTSPVGA
jgi:hypothetical protein